MRRLQRQKLTVSNMPTKNYHRVSSNAKRLI